MNKLGVCSWNLFLAPTMYNRINRLNIIKYNISQRLYKNNIICLQEVHSWNIGPISKLLFSIKNLKKYPKIIQILDVFSIIEGLFFPLFLYDLNKREIIDLLKKCGFNNFHVSNIPKYYLDSGLITASKIPIVYRNITKLKSNSFIPSYIFYTELDTIKIVNCHLPVDESSLTKNLRKYYRISNKLCCVNLKRNFVENNYIIHKLLNGMNNILLCGDLNINYNTKNFFIFQNYLNFDNIEILSNTTQCPYTYKANKIDYFLYKKLNKCFKPGYGYILKMNYIDEQKRLEEIIGSDHFAIETRI